LKLERYFSVLFDFEQERNARWMSWGMLLVLYLIGAWLWSTFFDWGKINFYYEDWTQNAPRLYFIQSALQAGQFPLHMPDTSALLNVSDRYLVVPDSIFSPQIVLLKYISPGRFVWLDVLVFYSAGVIGLLVFRQKYKLSLVAFTPLFLLFNFNGHIQSHFSVGHLNWVGYFLFPWFFILLFELVEKDQGWRWVTGMASLLFFILLQGSFHQYNWMLIFLGLLWLSWLVQPGVYRQRSWQVLKALLASGVLGVARLLPAVLEEGRFNQEFLTGYPTLTDLWTSMVVLKVPQEAFTSPLFNNHSLAWWEFDLYLGLAGVLFVIIFGLLRGLGRSVDKTSFSALSIPVGALVLFSIGDMYFLINQSGIPLLSAERVTTRMITLPLTFFLMQAGSYLQNWLNAYQEESQPSLYASTRLIVLGGIGLLFHDLWIHLQAWQVSVASQILPRQEVNLAAKVVSNHPDPVYIRILITSGLLILITYLFLIIQSLRQHSRQA